MLLPPLLSAVRYIRREAIDLRLKIGLQKPSCKSHLYTHGLWNLLKSRVLSKIITMTDITSHDNGKQKAGVAKSKKLNAKIDMTPMVDLGFLLITFFIFTSTMGQPGAMKLVM